jgi:hypothetical protein
MTFVIWNEWFTVHLLERHNVVPIEDPESVQWEKPGVSWTKCNVDATFVASSGSLLCVFVFVILMGSLWLA